MGGDEQWNLAERRLFLQSAIFCDAGTGNADRRRGRAKPVTDLNTVRQNG